MMSSINVATFRELLKKELPRLLREHPESRHEIWGLMLESFPSRQEFATLHQELRGFREDTNHRFERLDGRMQEGFQAVRQDLDRLGRRWGIRNESVFRQTIATLLEKSFGARVESRWIDGEEFDVIVSDGAHILVEITASAGPKTQERLERKRRIYTKATGVVPARVVLATASIHSRRAQALREAGFEVIEPEEEALE